MVEFALQIRTVAFNQQINAVVPEQYNILFLYVLFQMSKDYLVEDINMALKGILSKSKLEEKEVYYSTDGFAGTVFRLRQTSQQIKI